ncbi:MAG: tRNA lysidine(34) synthetase TilS [Kofleriaceae bacterium]
MTNTTPVDPVSAAVKLALGRVGPGLYGVACSGGADSIALAHATMMHAGPSQVVVMIVDHQLSPGSAAVAREVASWATGQGATALIRPVNVARRASVEAAARRARYAALEQLADELGVACVLLGHTARDQAETVLMRVLRGTGPAGLVGIPAHRGRFVRPLLERSRAAIESYVADHGLPTWHDPMNDDHRLTRVRIRQDVMPVLRRENPRLDAALTRLAASAAEWLEVIDSQAAALGRFPIACSVLAREPAAIRKRAVALALERSAVDYDAPHLERIDRIVTARSRGRVAIDLPGARLIRSYDTLALEAADADAAARADLRLPTGPYIVRTWRPGDRMRPARLKGKSRKLSDLFIDAKVSRAVRATARVVVRTSDDVIVWAEFVGLAFDAPPDLLLVPAQTGESF